MFQTRRLGMKTLPIRDVTLSMTYDIYNPITWGLDPFFTPGVSKRYAIEYIEDRIGPSIESAQLTEEAGKGKPA
jgi:hypothetical protein